MWPWEHLAIGYLTYSLLVRLGSGTGPSAGAALAVAAGTQFPDLVDKPLGWGTSILPSGQSLAHSLLFALPVIVLVVVLARRFDRNAIGTAFGIGYLSHLPGDVFYPVLLGGEPRISPLLWPILPSGGSDPGAILAHVTDLFASFTTLLNTPAGTYYLLAEVTLLFAALLLWIADGTPGLPGLDRGEAIERG